MKRVIITLTLDCPDEIPGRVLDWMAGNLVDHVDHEFCTDYEPEWLEPEYVGPPLDAIVDVAVNGRRVDSVFEQRAAKYERVKALMDRAVAERDSRAEPVDHEPDSTEH